jgi:hydrogenase expression/formation protein HypD
MRFVDEYRDEARVGVFLRAIERRVTRPWTLMEICGGQTHTFVRYGIDRMLPASVTLVHGPGCPVCVTPVEQIDRAIAIARRPGVILTSFGDMLRVPGTRTDLLAARAEGADVRFVYSPLDALRLARENPTRPVVFFAVGFETTSPTTAMAVWQASRLAIGNFSILCAHVRVPPAIEALLGDPENRVQAFLAAGHVCAVMGYHEYEPIAARWRVPIVVAGFEPLDLVEAVHMAVTALEEGRASVENQYARAVRREGNIPAQRLLEEVFEPCDRAWRGIGVIPGGGHRLRDEFAAHDAEQVFDVGAIEALEPAECRSGDVLRGRLEPPRCPAFGARCTPEHPLGAPMVSSEGACAAYYQYGRVS